MKTTKRPSLLNAKTNGVFDVISKMITLPTTPSVQEWKEMGVDWIEDSKKHWKFIPVFLMFDDEGSEEEFYILQDEERNESLVFLRGETPFLGGAVASLEVERVADLVVDFFEWIIEPWYLLYLSRVFFIWNKQYFPKQKLIERADQDPNLSEEEREEKKEMLNDLYD